MSKIVNTKEEKRLVAINHHREALARLKFVQNKYPDRFDKLVSYHQMRLNKLMVL